MRSIVLALNCMRRWIGCYASVAGVTIINIASGAQFEEAKVTAVVHDVKLLRGQVILRSATLNDEIREDTAVRTGVESRSELTFPDLTLARLGANTIFSFNQKAREVNLINGAILLRVPKNSGGATITTDAVTAGIVGTTVMMEYHPRGIAKFIVLEGVARLYLKKRLGESILVHAGEMMIIRWGATQLSDPVAVDISEIMRTSLLITGFGPLPSAPLIATTETDQSQRKSQGQLVETNLVIYGSGTLVTLADETDQRFAAAPPANPKFGRPETIKAPDPFPITSTTLINTDPIITNGNITASGKIYRGPADDGPMSQYVFGSTSAFDTELKFDRFFKDLANLPVAVFKFQNLALLGNPTITVGQNGVTKLELIGVNGITSGAPGGGLTFNGLDLLFLGTKAGSINLTDNLSFQNLSTLGVYARGAGSNLTLASPISGVTKLILAAENAVQINAKAAANLNVLSEISVDSGGDFVSNGTLALAVQNSGRIIDTGGNIDLTVGRSISSQAFFLLIANNDGGRIGTGGNIVAMLGGNLTAGSIDTLINDRNGGSIDSGANLNFNIGGALTTTGDASLGVSTRNDGAGGGSIGTNASVSVQAQSILVGGALTAFLSANAGGHIGASAQIQFNVGGALHSGTGTFFDLESTAYNTLEGPFIAPGMIGSDALIDVSAANVTSDAFIEADIFDRGGHIGGNAGITLNISGDIASRDELNFNIGTADFPGGVPGTIGGNAAIDVSAANISASSLFTQINNSNGGSIGGNATINFAVSGNATVTNDATLRIDGSNGAASAAININGGNYNAGGTFLGFIDGNGVFAINNASIRADMVKIGVFGNNGTLRIGGGSMTAGTLMQLYAPGSNGTVDFVSNATLNTSNGGPVIVANTVTIENGVVVTINAESDGVPVPADVFTNVPNYTGSGGNGSTTGRFAGTGATKQPFGQAPPFVTKRSSSDAVALSATVARPPEAGSLPSLGSAHPHSGPQARYRSSGNRPTFCVIDTSQLQSVLDNAAPAINGKLHVSSTKADRKTAVRIPAGSLPRRKNIARSVDAKAPSPVLASNAR